METILQTNDDLLRVLDTYKRVVEGPGEGGRKENGEKVDKGSEGGGGGEGVRKMESARTEEASGTVGGEAMEMSKGGEGQGATAAAGVSGDILIDLGDLNFGSLPPAPSAGTAQQTVAGASSSADSLLSSLGILGECVCVCVCVCQSLCFVALSVYVRIYIIIHVHVCVMFDNNLIFQQIFQLPVLLQYLRAMRVLYVHIHTLTLHTNVHVHVYYTCILTRVHTLLQSTLSNQFLSLSLSLFLPLSLFLSLSPSHY